MANISNTSETYGMLEDMSDGARVAFSDVDVVSLVSIVSWASFIVLAPVVLLLALPFIFYGLLSFVIVFSNAAALARPLFRHLSDDEYALESRKVICRGTMLYGKVVHGAEYVNFERIPRKGGALLLNYHGGAVPVDNFLLQAKSQLELDRKTGCVVDRWFFKMAPGFTAVAKLFGLLPGTVEDCCEILKGGHLLQISPGGAREGFFTDDQYTLVWGKRLGFAKIATEAKVPIIPVFAENCREAFKSVAPKNDSLLSWFYEKTRLPFVPIYGGLPVKIRIYIGEPIPYDPSNTLQDISEKVQGSIRSMIKQHQRLPGSMTQALMDRFREPKCHTE